VSTYECAVGDIQCLVEFDPDGNPIRVSSRVKGRIGARDSTRVIWWRNARKARTSTVEQAIRRAQQMRSANTSSEQRK